MDREIQGLYTSLFSKYLLSMKNLIVLKRELMNSISEKEEAYNRAFALLNTIQSNRDIITYIRDGKQLESNDSQSHHLEIAPRLIAPNFIPPANLVDYLNGIIRISKTDDATLQAIDRHIDILKQITDKQSIEISYLNNIRSSILATHHTIADLLKDPHFKLLNENNQSLISGIIGRVQKSTDYRYQSKILKKFGSTAIQIAYLIVLSLLVSILILGIVPKMRRKKAAK